MTPEQYEKNVALIIDMLLKNAAHSFGLDFMLINETAIENSKRLKAYEEPKNAN